MTEENMKISVNNYGPIAEAKDIELCPLTVFVGPSNTGKSYLAILIYALLHSFQNRSSFASRFRRKPKRQETISFDSKAIEKELSLVEKLFKSDMENIKFSDLPEELQKWTNEEIAKAVNHKFCQELLRCMGISAKEDHLISNNFNFNLEDNQKSLILRSFDETPSLKIKETDSVENMFAKSFIYKFYMFLEKEISREIKTKTEIKAWMFLDWISENIFHSDGKTESFYLPAARTGIMQSHRAIAGALVQRATFAGIENFSVPTLSGIVSDFLEELILIDTSKIPDPAVGEVANEMEKEILHGSIKSKSLEGNQYPQFSYKQNGLEVPLLCSSSMVSELTPVVLFIRHRVGKGDLLIIEEPEAHLHPEAQRNIAKTVVRLVRTGVRVMVTTHSDYFLDQLANYVRLSKLSKAKRNKLADDQNLFLKENEIGAYVFNRQREGTIVKRLNFDQENGLSPEDHDKVSSDLYNDTVELLDQLDQ
ncbi:MAG: hypothetical protein M2R45_03464 [Verrucomicrobia subdivision 3 bacterium]|nr:hypothetical protein [Limisphaerales bacterium]